MDVKTCKRYRLAFVATMFMVMCSLTGCTEYEKDITFNTDLSGTYSWTVGSEKIKYLEKATYTFDNNEYYKENNDNESIVYRYKNMLG